MKKLSRWLAPMLVLVLVMSVAFSGCGSKTETDTQLLETFSELLAKDYEVYYLFYAGGLPVDGETSLEEGGTVYYRSASVEYRSLSDLEKLLKSTYARQGDRDALLGRIDQATTLLFIEENGTLYKSGLETVTVYPYEVQEDTIRLTARSEQTATFTFQEEGLDGSLYETTLSMSRSDKTWLLDGQAIQADRTLLREGSGKDSLFDTGEARRTAQAFLDALTAGDAAAIESLSWAPSGTYAAWSGLKVSSARIVEELEDLDVQGDYLAELQVEDGAGVLREGTVRYRLKIGMVNAVLFGAYGDGAGELSVDYFQPEELAPYELKPTAERTDGAANAVDRLLGFFGVVTFEKPEDLGADRITEYVLIDLMDEQDQAESFSLAQVRDRAGQLFGLENFSPSQSFYSAQQNGYLASGRGLQLNHVLTFPQASQDDRSVVEVRVYADPLQTRVDRVVAYTLARGNGGVWQFVSAVAQ